MKLTAAAEWSVWTTTARIVVTAAATLPAARRITEAVLRDVDEACSRFRPDSELCRLPAGRPTQVSPLLAELVGVALDAARRTDGDVDPTVGGVLAELGYDRDLDRVTDTGVPVPVVTRHVPGWQRIRLTGRTLTVPAGVPLDLGATAKAFAADRCAELVSRRCGTGVLVSLGGDLATAGPAPLGGWQVLVRDRPGDPECTVTLAPDAALATSSTATRWWRRGGRRLHHIIDPATCLPAAAVWRTVSVAAPTCVLANTATTAALVRGEPAVAWLRRQRLPALLVGQDDRVITVGDWPGAVRP
ncbi:MAG TPA: FAD:protein FMN transferase [Pseudonocardiaceae bacterium]|nr:FAD:protein FMN transferase [Pseudonocardiaceae bacterium]